MIYISIFGKEGCHLCENRLEFFSKIKKMNTDIEMKIDYYDVKTASGLVAFSLQNEVFDIPAVIMNNENGVLKNWNGATEVPNTKEVMAIFEGLKNG